MIYSGTLSPPALCVRRLRPALLLIAILFLQACAGIGPGFETPTVTVSSFRTVPSSGNLPTFEIGLRVTNPNNRALKLQGVAYTISLENREIIKGVGNDLPVIEAYGEDEVLLSAAASLFAGIGLIRDLMETNNDSVSYEFEAKLDVGAFLPSIRVTDAGSISLR